MAETEEKCPICGGNYMQSYPSPLKGEDSAYYYVMSCHVLYMFYVSLYVLCIVVIRPLVR